jgi:hypothetical protein
MATTGSATYAVNSGLTSSGGFNLSGAATFASTMDYSSSTAHNAAGVATIAVSVGYLNNTNHADSTTFGAELGASSSSGFLWNESDAVTTTWTKVDYPN